MSSETRIIAGAPYVFAREKLAKPFHAEVVTLKLFPALCPTGCGLFYMAPDRTDASRPGFGTDNRCPDCDRVPPRHEVANEPDEVEVAVKMAFGNVIASEFMRVVKASTVARVDLAVGDLGVSRARAGEPDK